MGGSGSQRHREGVKDCGKRHWSPHLDAGGSGIGGWGPDGKHLFPSTWDAHSEKSRKGDGKNRVGIPDCVRTPPCELAPELRALALAWLRRAIRAHWSLRSAR